MTSSSVTQEVLVDFLNRLDSTFSRSVAVYLIGETTQVLEGMRGWASKIELTTGLEPADRSSFLQAVRDLEEEMNVKVLDEFPGDLIPLPDGYEARTRSAVGPKDGLRLKKITLAHFDPYSVSYRFIARGDEADYQVVLAFLKNGWIDFPEMDSMLETLLPQFSMATIQQDPAEFRRKYKSLVQMWRSARPHSTHRVTVV